MAIAVASQAQQSSLRLNVNYTMANPSGSLKDYVEEASWRGWTANLLYGISDKLAVGLGLGFHDFYQKYPRAVYQLQEGGEISAVLTNSHVTALYFGFSQFDSADK